MPERAATTRTKPTATGDADHTARPGRPAVPHSLLIGMPPINGQVSESACRDRRSQARWSSSAGQWADRPSATPAPSWPLRTAARPPTRRASHEPRVLWIALPPPRSPAGGIPTALPGLDIELRGLAARMNRSASGTGATQTQRAVTPRIWAPTLSTTIRQGVVEQSRRDDDAAEMRCGQRVPEQVLASPCGARIRKSSRSSRRVEPT